MIKNMNPFLPLFELCLKRIKYHSSFLVAHYNYVTTKKACKKLHGIYDWSEDYNERQP